MGSIFVCVFVSLVFFSTHCLSFSDGLMSDKIIGPYLDLSDVGYHVFPESKCLRDEEVLQTLPVGTTASFYFSDLGAQLTWGTVSTDLRFHYIQLYL